MHQADSYLRRFGGKLRRQYGFLADPSQPLWLNIQQRIREMPASTLLDRPSNLACHNLLTSLPKPPGTEALLGLGLNFCINSRSIHTTKLTFSRLREDLQRLYAIRDIADDEDNND